MGFVAVFPVGSVLSITAFRPAVVGRRLEDAFDACNSTSGCGIKLGLERWVPEGELERFLMGSMA